MGVVNGKAKIPSERATIPASHAPSENPHNPALGAPWSRNQAQIDRVSATAWRAASPWPPGPTK